MRRSREELWQSQESNIAIFMQKTTRQKDRLAAQQKIPAQKAQPPPKPQPPRAFLWTDTFPGRIKFLMEKWLRMVLLLTMA